MNKAPNPTDKHVGSRARMRRLMLDMSQTDLGDALGITFQQVQKYEKGTNRIGASRLQQMANALQVPVAFFFEGLPATKGEGQDGCAAFPHFAAEFVSTPEGLSLIKAYMQIKRPTLRRSVGRLVEDLA